MNDAQSPEDQSQPDDENWTVHGNWRRARWALTGVQEAFEILALICADREKADAKTFFLRIGHVEQAIGELDTAIGEVIRQARAHLARKLQPED